MSDTKTNLGSVRLSDIINQYRYSLEAINRSQKTISWYMDILSRYSRYLEMGGCTKPINELGRHELESYIKHLKNSIR